MYAWRFLPHRGSLLVTFALALTLGIAVSATQPDPPKKDKKDKEVAGKAEVLKAVPKKYATFLGHDAGSVTLRLEGEDKDTTWPLKADAEIKVLGWWGRPGQFHKGDRVWVWFAIDRAKKPRSILMLADEISQQDINGTPYAVVEMEPKGQTITLSAAKGKERVLKLDSKAPDFKKDSKVYVQSAGDKARLLLTPEQLDQQRAKQKEYLSSLWLKEGLPGTVGFLHPLGGEMEVMLDHEGMRWGRYLKQGDKVTLKHTGNGQDFKPISVVVKKVQPWREYTRLLLVSNNSFDQMDLALGQRIGALVPEPPADVQNSHLPPDLDRPRSKEERIEWFLSTVYCTCKVGGDQCTGMFYVQASCNVNSCGMPNNIKNQVIKMIDKGMTDRQIIEELLKTRGPTLLKPHLLP